MADGLLKDFVDQARRLGAQEINLATHKEEAYYAKRGFSLVRREKWFNDIDMVIMRLDIATRGKVG